MRRTSGNIERLAHGRGEIRQGLIALHHTVSKPFVLFTGLN